MKKKEMKNPFNFHRKNRVRIPEVMTLDLIREDLSSSFNEDVYTKEILLPLLKSAEIDEFTVQCQDRYLNRQFDELILKEMIQHENNIHEIGKLTFYHKGEKNHITNCMSDLDAMKEVF